MNKYLSFLIVAMAFAFSSQAHAFYTELGVQYGQKKTTFDTDNYFTAESLTGSMSLYFFERLALELSYTEANGTRQEKANATDPTRTTYQKSTVMGADLILMFADKKDLFQPYIKGGAAQIHRRQEVKIEGQDSYIIEPADAIVPSYGVGLKIAVTEAFGIKISYDVWKTPVDDGAQTDDTSIRAGITWIL
jgi:hypothetical protein